MSAPPMGMTRATPKASARSVMTAIRSIGSTANDPPTAPASSTSDRSAVAAAMPLVTSCWPEYRKAFGVISPCSFPNAIALPENEHAEVALARELEDRDERGRSAAGAVEQRDHLRHRRHLHHPRAREAGDPADGDPGEDERDAALHVCREERRDDRDQHAGRGDAVAL